MERYYTPSGKSVLYYAVGLAAVGGAIGLGYLAYKKHKDSNPPTPAPMPGPVIPTTQYRGAAPAPWSPAQSIWDEDDKTYQRMAMRGY